MKQKTAILFFCFIFLIGGIINAKTIDKFGYKVHTPEKDTKKPNVYIVTTGGTIAESEHKNRGAKPALSGNELINAVPSIKNIADIYLINFCNIDSSHMTPKIWCKLSQLTNKILKEKDITGVVITHGTDTMAMASFFLDLTVKSNKPVVFTGAMRNSSQISADGPINLYNAVLQASSSIAKDFGVTVTLNNYINSALYVNKTNTVNVQTFNSGEKGYLGYIIDNKIIKYHDNPLSINFECPNPNNLPEIPYFTIYPGSSGKYIKEALENDPEGIVIDGFGAGNVNKKVSKMLVKAIKKNIPVVVSSQVYKGPSYPIYGDIGGGTYLKNKGAILAGDLGGQKARLLLMLAINKYGNNTSKISKCFNELTL